MLGTHSSQIKKPNQTDRDGDIDLFFFLVPSIATPQKHFLLQFPKCLSLDKGCPATTCHITFTLHVYHLTFMLGDTDGNAAKPVTTVQDSVSTSVSVKLLDIL